METKPVEFNTYYAQYIEKAGTLPLAEELGANLINTVSFFESIPKEKLNFTYEVDKWSPLQILLHLIDTERVFAYRALFIARSLDSDLQGFDQDEFVNASNASNMGLDSLLNQYFATRTATIQLFKNFSDAELVKIGRASKSPLSVRAAGKIICGHEIHHINIIKERYL